LVFGLVLLASLLIGAGQFLLVSRSATLSAEK